MQFTVAQPLFQILFAKVFGIQAVSETTVPDFHRTRYPMDKAIFYDLDGTLTGMKKPSWSMPYDQAPQPTLF